MGARGGRVRTVPSSVVTATVVCEDRTVTERREPPCPTCDDFGLPRERGSVGVTLGGVHAPGSRLSVEVGLRGGHVSHDSDRTLVLELRDRDGHVIDSDRRPMGRLRADRSVALSVALPGDAPARYRQRLEILAPGGTPRVFEWDVEVPEQRVAADLSLSAATAAPGATLHLTVHNTGPTALRFGVDYALQRRDANWIDVDLTDPDDDVEWGWKLVAHTLDAGDSHSQAVGVPRHARPGRHRFVKTICAAAVPGAEVAPAVEFDVVAPA
jgi:hypothetical protein